MGRTPRHFLARGNAAGRSPFPLGRTPSGWGRSPFGTGGARMIWGRPHFIFAAPLFLEKRPFSSKTTLLPLCAPPIGIPTVGDDVRSLK